MSADELFHRIIIAGATVVCVFLVLQFIFGQIDRLLKLACDHSTLRWRFSKYREFVRLKRSVRERRWFGAKGLTGHFRIGLKSAILKRRIVRKIESSQLEGFVRDLYLNVHDDIKAQERLRRYIESRFPDIDTASGIELLLRHVDHSSFVLVSPSRPLMAGLFAGLARTGGGKRNRILVLGAELWIVLLFRWANPETILPHEPPQSVIRKGFGWLLRVTVGSVLKQGVAHECVHVFQEVQNRVLTKEFLTGDGAPRLGIGEWARCEFDALCFGSPMWIFALAIFIVLPIVLSCTIH